MSNVLLNAFIPLASFISLLGLTPGTKRDLDSLMYSKLLFITH